MHSDIPNYIPRGAKNISPNGIQVGLVTSDQIGGSNVLKPNEFSVRSASVHDAMIMESIEREAFLLDQFIGTGCFHGIEHQVPAF